jgi:hypothetical protein
VITLTDILPNWQLAAVIFWWQFTVESK